MKTDVLIIIPAFNEEGAILKVVSSIKKMYPKYDILVVNDGSSDATKKEALKSKAIVLSHPFNMGYGVTLQTGYKYAHQKGYKFIAQIDADGQHDPSGLGNLLEIVRQNEADIALGSRFLGEVKYKASFFRMIGMWIFKKLLFVLTGARFTDVTTGYQAMNRKVLDVFTKDIFPVDYPDADVLLLVLKLGFRVKEIPVKMYPNPIGKSMHSNIFQILYYIFKMFLSLFLTKIRKYPNVKKHLAKRG